METGGSKGKEAGSVSWGLFLQIQEEIKGEMYTFILIKVLICSVGKQAAFHP